MTREELGELCEGNLHHVRWPEHNGDLKKSLNRSSTGVDVLLSL